MRALALPILVCASVVTALAQPAPMPDRDWKRWVDQVRPLMTANEAAEVKHLPVTDRGNFREVFWLMRDPDPATLENPNRVELEYRIEVAEKRFRPDGKSWNDCGRTYLLLGKPNWMRNDHGSQHFSTSDPLTAFRDQEMAATEVWVYRNHPRLPASPDGYAFRFTPSCEAIASPSSDRLLQQVAASYQTHRG